MHGDRKLLRRTSAPGSCTRPGLSARPSEFHEPGFYVCSAFVLRGFLVPAENDSLR